MIEFSEMRGPNKILGPFCKINGQNILFGPLISENSIVTPPLPLALCPLELISRKKFNLFHGAIIRRKKIAQTAAAKQLNFDVWFKGKTLS